MVSTVDLRVQSAVSWEMSIVFVFFQAPQNHAKLSINLLNFYCLKQIGSIFFVCSVLVQTYSYTIANAANLIGYATRYLFIISTISEETIEYLVL